MSRIALCFLIKLYSEAILGELEALPGYIVGGYNPNNRRYADDNALTADTERKYQEFLEKESQRKGTNHQKRECMNLSRRSIPRWQLQIGDVRIKKKKK